MGIRFLCPNGHKLNVKSFLAGKRAVCPQCGAKVLVPNSPDSPADEIRQQGPASAVNPEVAPAKTMSQSLADTASPSVIIAIAESEVAATPKVEAPAPVAPVAVAGTPESIVAAPSQPAAVTVPVALTPDVQYQIRRARNRRNQLRMAVVLLVLVIVLAVVLIWVLRRDAEPATGGPATPAKTSGMAEPLPIYLSAMVFFRTRTLGFKRREF